VALKARAADKFRAAQALVEATVEKLRARGLSDEEIRRLFEAELAGLNRGGQGV
jgi:DNA-binding transcriptional regulator YhcF (GntR family)